MYLKFYLDENNTRVYTLKKTSPTGVETQSAHPARFSPEDSNSKYRIIIKKRFGLLPTQKSKQWSRRRLMISFVLFFCGWKACGYALNDMLLWTVDESTGQGRFLTPAEGKARRESMERTLEQRFVPQPAKKFDFDD